MIRGFVLGKFMPPHAGHVYLCDVASQQVDELTILVCSLPGDPVPGALRRRWMTELFPRARVLHLDRPDVPQQPEDHPQFWDIWRGLVGEFHPEPLDLVFASEAYGMRLAQETGARFVPVDIERVVMPVSGTVVRENPFGHWRFIPPPVRPYFAKRVVVLGPESTGKTSLARQLAKHFDTIWVPELGRAYTELFGTECNNEDLLRIARAQGAANRAALRHANRVVICDTDAVATAVWSQMLIGRRDPWFDAFSDHAELYLLTDVDTPWIDDGTRYFPDQKTRRRFHDLFVAELTRRSIIPVRVGGSWTERFAASIAAIEVKFPMLGQTRPSGPVI